MAVRYLNREEIMQLLLKDSVKDESDIDDSDEDRVSEESDRRDSDSAGLVDEPATQRAVQPVPVVQ